MKKILIYTICMFVFIMNIFAQSKDSLNSKLLGKYGSDSHIYIHLEKEGRSYVERHYMIGDFTNVVNIDTFKWNIDKNIIYFEYEKDINYLEMLPDKAFYNNGFMLLKKDSIGLKNPVSLMEKNGTYWSYNKNQEILFYNKKHYNYSNSLRDLFYDNFLDIQTVDSIKYTEFREELSEFSQLYPQIDYKEVKKILIKDLIQLNKKYPILADSTREFYQKLIIKSDDIIHITENSDERGFVHISVKYLSPSIFNNKLKFALTPKSFNYIIYYYLYDQKVYKIQGFSESEILKLKTPFYDAKVTMGKTERELRKLNRKIRKGKVDKIEKVLESEILDSIAYNLDLKRLDVEIIK